MDINSLVEMTSRMGLALDNPLLMQTLTHMRGSQSSLHNAPPRLTLGDPEHFPAQFEEYKVWFKEDCKIPPHPAPFVPRDYLIQSRIIARQENDADLDPPSKGFIGTRLTVSGFTKHSSKIPLQDLEAITFSQMLVRKVHKGTFLLCRSIVPFVRIMSIQTVVEDVGGIAYDLSIYNFPTAFDCSNNYLDSLYPVGTVIIIREPTFKAATQGPHPLLRVDSPTDIVLVASNDPVLSGITWRVDHGVPDLMGMRYNSDSWRIQGNNHFKAAQWLPAAIAYSRGLQLDPDSTVLRLNRAEAYLRLQFWSGALADAELAESTTRLSKEHRDKALYRAARAQYARGNYEAAEARFTEWHRSHPDDRDVLEWIARSRERLRESQHGSYDWLKLLKQSEKRTRLDVADYRGPIQVTQLQGRGGGRGVVASKDICVGELVLVSKPFISVFENDLRGNVIQIAADMLSSKLKTRTQSAAVAFAAQKLYGNPDLHDHVFGLYAGPDYPAPPSFYPPEVSKAARAVDPLYPSTDIDIAQLDAICTYNAFQAMPIRPDDVQSQEFEKPTALHLLPSLFNHSCVPNAIWNCIGDVMVVRAMDTISAGAEITMPYSLEPSYVQREHALHDHMLSGCDCWLCNADRADGDTALRRRDALENKYRPSTLRSTSLSLLRKWEKDFLSTYHTSRGPVRPSMYAPHVLLAEKLWSSHASNSFRESIDENLKALTCLGYKIQTNKSQPTKGNSKRKGVGTLPIERSSIPTSTVYQLAIVVMLKLILLYTQMNDKVNATKWLKAANWVTTTIVGGDKDVFLYLYDAELRQMSLFELAERTL